MHSDEVLAVARHPTATFSIASATVSGPEAIRLRGWFTLRGARQPVECMARMQQTPQGLRLTGRFSMRQTDSDMKPYAKFGGVVSIADELHILGDIRLRPTDPGEAR
jgi:polyisoprenoid-binding protein YceI